MYKFEIVMYPAENKLKIIPTFQNYSNIGQSLT